MKGEEFVQEDRIPKVFISYSWSSDSNTVSLAERLSSDGVDVILDKWELKEGQDKYSFMERCVNDSDVTKVLIVCDSNYVEKANTRQGGVGDETAIISPEIYGQVKQNKFIPIVIEKSEGGEPCLPTYIKSRIYIDLSDGEKYEEEYEKLVRSIYEKPLYRKPAIGSRPAWLDENETNLFPLQKLIKEIKNSRNQNTQEKLIKTFEAEHVEILKTYYNANISGEEVYEKWNQLKSVRDCYLDWLEVVLESECDAGEILCDYFEYMYNTLNSIKTFDDVNFCVEQAFDIYKIYIWELFICTVTCLRYYDKFDILYTLLSNTYFLINTPFDNKGEASNYSRFRYYSSLLEDQYKPMTNEKKTLTLMGKTLCVDRQHQPIYTKVSLANADLFLYQVFGGFDVVSDYQTKWFPTCYVYASKNNWDKLQSKRYCKKICTLFGVSDIEKLKEVIQKCKYEKPAMYNNCYYSAGVILDDIEIEKIGTLN